MMFYAKLTFCSVFILFLFGFMQVAWAERSYYGKALCAYPGFTCVSVGAGETWKSLFPDKAQREIVKKLNRSNMRLSTRSWIVVPNNFSKIDYNHISPFPKKIKAPGERLILVNLSKHAFAAYDANGKLVRWGPASGGKAWCEDSNEACHTKTGEHRIQRKKGAGCVSSKYPIKTGGGAPMPYCMHYYGGYALHGANLPGFHASHGCVRLFYDDAKWLNQQFAKVGTKIIVKP